MTGLVIDLPSLGDTAARLATATGLGALIGLNRRVRHHPAYPFPPDACATTALTSDLSTFSFTSARRLM